MFSVVLFYLLIFVGVVFLLLVLVGFVLILGVGWVVCFLDFIILGIIVFINVKVFMFFVWVLFYIKNKKLWC